MKEHQIRSDFRISPVVAEFTDLAAEKAYRSRNTRPMVRQGPVWCRVMGHFTGSFYLILGWVGFFLIFFVMFREQFPCTIAMVMAMLISQYVFIPNRVEVP